MAEPQPGLGGRKLLESFTTVPVTTKNVVHPWLLASFSAGSTIQQSWDLAFHSFLAAWSFSSSSFSSFFVHDEVMVACKTELVSLVSCAQYVTHISWHHWQISNILSHLGEGHHKDLYSQLMSEWIPPSPNCKVCSVRSYVSLRPNCPEQKVLKYRELQKGNFPHAIRMSSLYSLKTHSLIKSSFQHGKWRSWHQPALAGFAKIGKVWQ